jgi:hypothetical protein
MSIYVKECPIVGPQSPRVTSKGVLKYSLPEKCTSCDFLHEARCSKVRNRLVRLDYGPCGVEGSKELIEHSKASRLIPQKCVSCKFLSEKALYGLVCVKDSELWGDVPRGLDF